MLLVGMINQIWNRFYHLHLKHNLITIGPTVSEIICLIKSGQTANKQIDRQTDRNGSPIFSDPRGHETSPDGLDCSLCSGSKRGKDEEFEDIQKIDRKDEEELKDNLEHHEIGKGCVFD